MSLSYLLLFGDFEIQLRLLFRFGEEEKVEDSRLF